MTDPEQLDRALAARTRSTSSTAPTFWRGCANAWRPSLLRRTGWRHGGWRRVWPPSPLWWWP